MTSPARVVGWAVGAQADALLCEVQLEIECGVEAGDLTYVLDVLGDHAVVWMQTAGNGNRGSAGHEQDRPSRHCSQSNTTRLGALYELLKR